MIEIKKVSFQHENAEKAEDTRVTVTEGTVGEDSRIYNLKITSPETWRDMRVRWKDVPW